MGSKLTHNAEALRESYMRLLLVGEIEMIAPPTSFSSSDPLCYPLDRRGRKRKFRIPPSS